MTDAERIAALETRLRLLEDKEEIRHLRDSYHACINDGRYGEIADLFTDDAFVRLGYLAEYRGRDAINAADRVKTQSGFPDGSGRGTFGHGTYFRC